MRKLDTIVWSIGARQRRLHISSTTPVWGTGTPLASWLSQIDFWSRSSADGCLVSLCEIVQRHAGDSEHRVLEADGETITLCSRIDPAAARDRLALLAEASVFLSSSTDLATVATAAARLAVPGLADWCVLRLSPALERVQRLIVGDRDSAREKEIRDIERRRHLRDQWAATLRGDGCTLTVETTAAPPPVRPGALAAARAVAGGRRVAGPRTLVGDHRRSPRPARPARPADVRARASLFPLRNLRPGRRERVRAAGGDGAGAGRAGPAQRERDAAPRSAARDGHARSTQSADRDPCRHAGAAGRRGYGDQRRPPAPARGDPPLGRADEPLDRGSARGRADRARRHRAALGDQLGACDADRGGGAVRAAGRAARADPGRLDAHARRRVEV